MELGAPTHAVEFLLKAVHLVIRCRRILMWSYVYALNIKDDAKRALFECVFLCCARCASAFV